MKIVTLRSGLPESIAKFTRGGRAEVGFLGGSITEMRGYSTLTEQSLAERFPRCEFVFTNAGMSSTCSDTGAFRLGNDLLAGCKLDLLFVEFAVNDNQDGHLSAAESIRAMEGIVRQLRRSNPRAEAVFLYCANESHNAVYAAGGTPEEIRAHERVARYYGIPAVNFALDVATRLKAGEFDWERDFGGVHPAPFGARIYSRDIIALFEAAAAKRLPHWRTPHALLDSHSLIYGKLLPVTGLPCGGDWRVETPDWNKLRGEIRPQFEHRELYCADAAGAETEIGFSGDCIGAFLLAGPDAGEVEFSIDGEPFRSRNLRHRYSENLHYPRTEIFAAGLVGGEHRMRLRLKSGACRILGFAVNEKIASSALCEKTASNDHL